MVKNIALLTDFGNADGYVGQMKGVIYSICPEANIIDISHDVYKHSIQCSAWVLENSYKYFPQNTIFLCVIDPDVGTNRKKLILKTNKYYFIAPDNGLLTNIFKKCAIDKLINIENSEYWLPIISQTFHGRDIFGPVAANLANNPDLIEKFGPAISLNSVQKLDIKQPILTNEFIKGSVVYIDHFGNLITNIPGSWVNLKTFNIQINNIKIKNLSTSYESKTIGEPLAIIGSHNFIEISANCGSAKDLIKSDINDEIVISFQ